MKAEVFKKSEILKRLRDDGWDEDTVEACYDCIENHDCSCCCEYDTGRCYYDWLYGPYVIEEDE